MKDELARWVGRDGKAWPEWMRVVNEKERGKEGRGKEERKEDERKTGRDRLCSGGGNQ